MSTDLSKQTNFALNRKLLSYVLIYGDSEEKEYSKLIWSMIGSGDIRIENINSFQQLNDLYLDSALTFIICDDLDNANQVIDIIKTKSPIASDTFGLVSEASLERRLHLMTYGFDAVFDHRMVQSVDFKQIILNKIEKARHRQTNRIMQDEYLRFRAALTASPDALIVFDNDRKLFFISEHYKRAYPRIADRLIRGISVEDAFNLARQEEGVTPDDSRYVLLRDFWFRLDGEIEFMSHNGRYHGRTWRMKAAPLTDSRGNPQGTIVTTIDITDMERRKRAIEDTSRKLAESLEKEQEASALQKQFIGMVSHEFRTPLAIIDGHAQVILHSDSPDLESIKTRCKTMRSAVARLVAMMDSILSSNLLKNGTMDPDPEEFDLGSFIEDLCAEQRELARTHIIMADISAAHKIVRLDRKMMTLILTNLLSNAVKFTKTNPQITIAATTEQDRIIIEVSDNGVGIPENELGQVFDRYFRASTSAGIPGTGIGLNLVRELVRLQGGTVTVESWVGVGTTFRLILQNLN